MTMPSVCGSSISTSIRTRLSMAARCGQSTTNITVPTTPILASPFRKLTKASLPKMRLNPASGEILESFGFSPSPDRTSGCCTMLPATPAMNSPRNGRPSATTMARISEMSSPIRPARSTDTMSALAMRFFSGTDRPPAAPADMVAMISAAMNSISQETRS
jgi:hypothetical protein